MQALFDFCGPIYSQKAFQARHECPYVLEDMQPEFVFKQVLTWFITEKADPRTGKVPLDEFVEKNRDSFAEGMAELMLGMKRVVRGDFFVVEDRNESIVIRQEQSGEEYHVEILPQNRLRFTPGQKLMGRIYPWKDHYRFAGIFSFIPVQENLMRSLGIPTVQEKMERIERDMLAKAESVMLRSRMSLLNALNKLPSNWIDSMVDEFELPEGGKKGEKTGRLASFIAGNLETILGNAPPGSADALRMVLRDGGFTRRSSFAKSYSDDTGYWWDRELPSSPAGYLRCHGLLYAGRMYRGERTARMVLVPADLRNGLERLLNPGDAPQATSGVLSSVGAKSELMSRAEQFEVRQRIYRHERVWSSREVYFFTTFRKNRVYVRVGFMDPALDVDDKDYSYLCRLEWQGDPDSWKFDVWDRDLENYTPGRLSGGSETGTPEECMDASLKELFGWDMPRA